MSVVSLMLGVIGLPTVRADSEAGSVRFQHLGVEEGLSNSRVHALLRDSRGFLWVGTEDGLNRYDGSSVVVHRAGPNDDVESLASSSVRAIFEDGLKRLWVGAGGSLHLYDRATDRFQRIPLDGGGASAGLAISAIRGDALGRMWVSTQKGLFRVDAATGGSVHFRHRPSEPASLSHDSVACLLVDRHQQLWIGTRRGLNRYDDASGQFLRLFQGADQPAWLRTVNVEQMLEDERGVLWLATVGDGLVSYVPETGAIRQYLPEAGGERGIGGRRILSLATDGRGQLYLGPEDKGLDVLDIATGRVVHHRPHPEDPSSLSSTSVTQLRFDDQGILWVGTFNGGVDYVSPYGRRFGLVTPRQGGLGNPHVLAFLEDHRGDLWIGTDGGGLDRWERKTGRFTSYRHDPHRSDSLAGDAVLSLHEDAAHDIWVGTWAAGLDRLDPRTGRFEHHRNPTVITDSVWTISADGDGNLLLGTFDRGAQVFEPATGTFRPLAATYPGLTTSDQVLATAVDAKGNVWLAEPSGPVYVDRGAGTAARHTLPVGVPQAILLDSRDNVWIGTDSGGLYCLSSEGQLRRRYTARDGLPSDNVVSMLEDESGDLWVGATLGLARIRNATSLPPRPEVLLFDVRDGLQGNELKRGAALRARTGEMFFGGQRGFNYFHPRKVLTNPRVPPVVLTGLQLFNKPLLVGAPGSPLATTITEARALTLSYRDSVVTFEFAALDFVIPSKHQYKYMLEGFDAAWNEVGSRRTATYTNLPPGDYTLRVAGSNNDGVWNEDGVRFPIRVVPPFWHTWTFRSLVAVGLLAAVLGAHRWRVRQHVLAEHALKSRVQEALAEVKTLTGLLPICAWCKRIHADDGRWRQIEAYVRDHTQADFTHGVCPECAEAARSRRPASAGP